MLNTFYDRNLHNLDEFHNNGEIKYINSIEIAEIIYEREHVTPEKIIGYGLLYFESCKIINNNISIKDDLFYKLITQKPYLCNDITTVKDRDYCYLALSIITDKQSYNPRALLNRIIGG